MWEPICVYIDPVRGGVDAERTAKYLQRFATVPLEIHVVPPCPTSYSLFQRVYHAESRSRSTPSWLYLQEGYVLTVGWEQAFLRAATAAASKNMAWVPTDWSRIAGMTDTFDLREEEIHYLSRHVSHHCAGWIAPVEEVSGVCIGFHGRSMEQVWDYPFLELKGFDWVQAVDTFVIPIHESVTTMPTERHSVSSFLHDSMFVLPQRKLFHRKPTLGLAMIVKDESSRLERTIRSMEPLVDDIVVADTGSEDNTPQLAKALGAQVIHVPWEEDFAAARNAVLDEMDTDWILILDADEEIAFSDFSRLREAICQPEIWAYELEARNYHRWNHNFAEWVANDGRYPESRGFAGWIPSYTVRLFRNDPRIRYSGCLHELLDYRLWQCLLPKDSLNIPVHHYGHVEKMGKVDPYPTTKMSMYISMAHTKVTNFPLDQAKAWWELGVLYGQLGNTGRAVECYLESLQYNRLFLYSHFSMLGAFMMLEEYEAALVLCRHLAKFVKNPVVVKIAEEARSNLQKAPGHKAFLEALLWALKPGPWSAYQAILEQSRLWSEKKELQRTYAKNTIQTTVQRS